MKTARGQGLFVDSQFKQLPRQITKIAIAAGIHRGNQLKFCGICDVVVGAGDNNAACLQQLPQSIQNRFGNFRKLVQKQNTPMRK